MFLLMCYLKCKLSFRYIQYCQSYVWIRKHKEIKEKRNVWSFEKNYLVLHNQGKIQIPRTPDVWQSVKWLSTGHQILSRGMKGRRGRTSAPCTTDWKGQRAHGSAWLTILTKLWKPWLEKKHPKKALILAVCHRLENESEKINREWHSDLCVLHTRPTVPMGAF